MCIVTGLAILFSSCEDFLTVTPHDSLASENALETIDDYNNLVLDPYSSLRSASYLSEFMMIVPEAMSDNLIINTSGRTTYNEFFDFQFSSGTFGTAGFWSAGYNAIMSANNVIANLETANPFEGTADEARSKNILAEALAIRGLIHFDLVKFYGKSYRSANDSDLGVPYKFTPTIDMPSRDPLKEVYEYIIADLEKSRSIIEDTYNASDNFRLNKKSIAAILSRIYLTMGNYAKASEYATLAITGNGSDICKLADYTKMWTTSMKISEVLFRVAVLQTDTQIPGNTYGQGDANSHKAEYVVSHSFLREFDADTDIRATQIQRVVSDGKQYNAVWKHHGRTGESTGKVDIAVIRASEVYLTRAEANYYLGREAEALNDLNLLRKQRYLEFQDGTEVGAVLLNAIMKERRLELAFEGHRFFDIKRTNADIQRDNYGDQADGSGVPANTLFIPATSPYYLLTIPQSEINANKNMVQNNY